MEQDIADNIIPQVYRYSYSDYQYQLSSSLNNFSDDTYFYSGMLIKVGDYRITPSFLLQAIQFNRSKGVDGEVFFFYEGLRDHNSQLGDTLGATFYAEEAVIPERNGLRWRPKARMVDEVEQGKINSGSWTAEKDGHNNHRYVTDGASDAKLTYTFSSALSAWFDIYVYLDYEANANLGTATYQLKSASETLNISIDQEANQGWTRLGSIYLQANEQAQIILTNEQLISGESMYADAAMAMLNRKRSPDVQIPTAMDEPRTSNGAPSTAQLMSNYPNPFNHRTTIAFRLPRAATVTINVYDAAGRYVRNLLRGHYRAGQHQTSFEAGSLSSGVYFIQLKSGQQTVIQKCILLK
jgi:hypothetical protein